MATKASVLSQRHLTSAIPQSDLSVLEERLLKQVSVAASSLSGANSCESLFSIRNRALVASDWIKRTLFGRDIGRD